MLGGHVGPGDTVVIVGAGPIGLAAILTARLFSPSQVLVIDPAAGRREAAHNLGAIAIDPAADDPIEVVRAMTGGLGADVAMEAVGIPETFELCTQLVRPGGRVANIGVHAQQGWCCGRVHQTPRDGHVADPQRFHEGLGHDVDMRAVDPCSLHELA